VKHKKIYAIDLRTKIPYLPEVYADSAYANKKNDEKLGKQNNKVPHRAYRNTLLTDRQKQENKQRSSIRYSHNLKTGMNIFKQMRSLRDCYAQ
jgi:IS5 family transposase